MLELTHYYFFRSQPLHDVHLACFAMVSRKKAAGKARKAAKDAKAVEAEEGQEEGQEQKAMEAQMQRLTMVDLLGEESGAVQQCLHGFEVDQKHCRDFMEAFRRGYNEKFDSGDNGIVSCFDAGLEATEAVKFTDIRMDKLVSLTMWNDAAGMKKLVSFCVCEGTHYILTGHDEEAHVKASFVYYFEEYIATHVEKTQPFINWHGVAELQHSDLHTLVKFLRKRIPCKCLDKKYNEVKSITKIGICSNQDCSLPERKVERKKILYCARCNVGYCSPECQRKHWPRHKKACKRVASERAEFDSKQQLL